MALLTPDVLADRALMAPNRPLPGRRPGAVVSLDTASWVRKQQDHLERQLFSKQACLKCHVEADKGKRVEGLPRYLPSGLRRQWFPLARFPHKSHDRKRCDDCHSARTSSQAADVLLPTLKDCIGCHDPGERRQVDAGQSDGRCVTCHTYHGKTE